MRLAKGILITETEGDFVAVVTGEAAMRFNGLIHLNEASAYLAEVMQSDFTEESLVQKLMERYEVTKERACEDVEKLVEEFRKKGLILTDENAE